VKDATGHSESRGEPITVSDSPLIPDCHSGVRHADSESGESGFVLSSYPDGKPAPPNSRSVRWKPRPKRGD